jgi:beta-phosphoglucomutase family hydrolase
MDFISQERAPFAAVTKGDGEGARSSSRMSQEKSPIITRELYQAALLDMDGVITDTASIHAACWKTMFDQFLEKWSSQNAAPFRPFDAADYSTHVDGKPRYQGVRDFLKSRSITLPDGTPMDPSSSETVCGLGNRKNELVNARLASTGADAYPGSVGFILYLRRMGIKTAIVTSSENCGTVLKAAKIEDLFDARVDGEVLVKERLTGKPAPDTFVKAAEMLQVPPHRALVIEDAISGVRAGREGGFGLVIGVNRKNNAEELKQNGADIVVNDLAELFTTTLPQKSDLAA